MIHQTRKRKKGRVLMTLGLLLIAAALGLTGYNVWDETQAEQNVKTELNALMTQLETTPPFPEDNIPLVPLYKLNPKREMPITMVDGHGYIGVLRIPALNLELPVLSEWSYPKLKIGPCRYVGSAYLDNLVIAAHNYRTHFAGLKNLQPGDLVYFTDMEENEFAYRVDLVETLAPTAIREMTSGEWALSLFTCTYGGQFRVTVRCDRLEEA